MPEAKSRSKKPPKRVLALRDIFHSFGNTREGIFARSEVVEKGLFVNLNAVI